MAGQTNSLVSQDSPALNSLLQSLHADLTVVGQHQDDLAEGVSYLGGALKGFQSIAYSGSTPGPVGQHLRQPGVAHQHVRRHRPVRRARPGAQPGARARPVVVRRPDGPAARRGLERRSSGQRPRRRARRSPSHAVDLVAGAGSSSELASRAAASRPGRTRGWAGSPSCSAPCCGGSGDGRAAHRADVQGRPLRAWPVSSSSPRVIVGGRGDEGRRPPTRSTSSTRAPRACSPAPPSTCSASRWARSPTCRTWATRCDVTLAVDQGTRIPSSAFASLVAPQLLGSPDVDLNPGYTGGPSLSSGATIPQDHTAVPVSTDEVLKELQQTLNAINPHAVGNLVTNLATDLDGQGANLNKLIASAAGTVQLLADKGNDLGQLNGTLAQLTGTLDTDTARSSSSSSSTTPSRPPWPSTRASSTTPSPSWPAPAPAWSTCSCPTSSRSRRTWARSRPSAARSTATCPPSTRSCRTATTSSRAPSGPTTRTTTGST